jgi:type IV secretion system protein VirB2
MSHGEQHMSSANSAFVGRFGVCVMVLLVLVAAPDLAFAQTSPFMTGATALQTNILSWLTPVAVILVMVLGAMAMANRISWGWCMAAILGIAISFGAPQIVTWVRGMFAV